MATSTSQSESHGCSGYALCRVGATSSSTNACGYDGAGTEPSGATGSHLQKLAAVGEGGRRNAAGWQADLRCGLSHEVKAFNPFMRKPDTSFAASTARSTCKCLAIDVPHRGKSEIGKRFGFSLRHRPRISGGVRQWLQGLGGQQASCVLFAKEVETGPFGERHGSRNGFSSEPGPTTSSRRGCALPPCCG